MEKFNEKELGDYQTPLFFSDIICKYLKEELKISPEIIIEPTCGIGNFLKSSSKFFPKAKIYGIDIDKKKLDMVDKTIANLELINEDIFTFKFNRIDKNNRFLIIGNPPWITNTELSKINSKNLPKKFNLKNDTGFNAMTGESNFDISESIILKMINEFKDVKSNIVFLCKTSVFRNIFKELIRNKIDYSLIKQINFNSSEIFKNDADACLFIIQFGGKPLKERKCSVSDISNPSKTLYEFGYVNDKFYSNLSDVPDIDGECLFEWRQGVKHDCSTIMELTCQNNVLTNKNDEILDLEPDLIYPLLKTSDLKKPIITNTSKYIIITQKKPNQDTTCIKNKTPKTWKYLNNNKEYFTKRKSIIYKRAHDFSIFGIGDYSFKKYKIAISGFYKNPQFCLAYDNKAFMFDDTCYYISFENYDDAYTTMLILNSELVKKFLKNIAFLDSKRPFTKKVLKRIDIGKCLRLLSCEDLKEIERSLGLKNYITHDKLDKYMKTILKS